MAFTICTSRLAGYKISDVDIADDAAISPSKLGLRTKEIFLSPKALQSDAAVIDLGAFLALEFLDTATKYAKGNFILPSDYAGNPVTVRVIWTAAVTTGDIKLTIELTATGAGGGTAVEATQTIVDTAATTAGTINFVDLSFAATYFAAGDLVGIKITRNPADAQDTLSATANILGVIALYTARG